MGCIMTGTVASFLATTDMAPGHSQNKTSVTGGRAAEIPMGENEHNSAGESAAEYFAELGLKNNNTAGGGCCRNLRSVGLEEE